MLFNSNTSGIPRKQKYTRTPALQCIYIKQQHDKGFSPAHGTNWPALYDQMMLIGFFLILSYFCFNIEKSISCQETRQISRDGEVFRGKCKTALSLYLLGIHKKQYSSYLTADMTCVAYFILTLHYTLGLITLLKEPYRGFNVKVGNCTN